ncbi:MAG: hypothetical protein JNJ55_14350 [Betaproteobacteria bacterium]|nr:hypothetical protein [Betaproteobacteria bacterium]
MLQSSKSLALTLGAGALFSFGTFAQAAFDFTTIHYPGATSTQVFGLNNLGKVAASSTVPGMPSGVGYVYDVAGGTYTPTPPAPGGGTMRPLGINDAGLLCGNVFDTVTGATQAYFLSGATYTPIALPGFTNTFCRALNQLGQASGYAENGGVGATGWILTPPASFTSVTFPGAVFMIGQGINNAGTQVGSVLQVPGAVYAGSPSGNYGYVRASGGTITQFRVNGYQTRARGINESNRLAGWVSIPAVGQRGFVIDAPSGGGYVDVTIPAADFIVFPGAANTIVEAINNAGEVAGIYDNGVVGESFGFVATLPVAERLEDLADLIDGMGLPRGIARSLLAKAEAAQASFAAGNTAAACGQLQALINQARAQSGRQLTVAQSNAIIDEATAIRRAMGCA